MDKYSLTEDGKTDYTKSSIVRAENQNNSILNNLPFFLIMSGKPAVLTVTVRLSQSMRPATSSRQPGPMPA